LLFISARCSEAFTVRRANFYYWLSVIWNDHRKEGKGWETGRKDTCEGRVCSF
jgi:hypothetical protein